MQKTLGVFFSFFDIFTQSAIAQFLKFWKKWYLLSFYGFYGTLCYKFYYENDQQQLIFNIIDIWYLCKEINDGVILQSPINLERSNIPGSFDHQNDQHTNIYSNLALLSIFLKMSYLVALESTIIAIKQEISKKMLHIFDANDKKFCERILFWNLLEENVHLLNRTAYCSSFTTL